MIWGCDIAWVDIVARALIDILAHSVSLLVKLLLLRLLLLLLLLLLVD